MAKISLKEIVGSVHTIETYKKVTYLHLVELTEPTPSGNTHALVNDEGETVGFAYKTKPGDGYHDGADRKDEYLIQYLEHKYEFVRFRPGMIQPNVALIKSPLPTPDGEHPNLLVEN